MAQADQEYQEYYDPYAISESDQPKSDFSKRLAGLKRELGHQGCFDTKHLGDVSPDHVGAESRWVIPFGIGSSEQGIAYLKVTLDEAQIEELKGNLGISLRNRVSGLSPNRGEPFEPGGTVNERVAQLMEQSGGVLVVRDVQPTGGSADSCTINFIVRPANDPSVEENTTGTRLHFDLTLPQAMALQQDLEAMNLKKPSSATD